MGLNKKWKIIISFLLLILLFCYLDNERKPQDQLLTKFGVNSISFYQKNISKRLFFKCRHKVSCSEYTKIAIKDRGFIQGVFKGWLRINNCF